MPLDAGAQNVRASPSHEGVLPTTSTGENVPINPPTVGLAGSALGGATGRLEDPYRAMAQLLCTSGC